MDNVVNINGGAFPITEYLFNNRNLLAVFNDNDFNSN